MKTNMKPIIKLGNHPESQSWYRPNVLQDLERMREIHQMSIVQQMLRVHQENFEKAKEAKGRAPSYSDLVAMAEHITRYPLARVGTGREGSWTDFARKVNTARLEKLGIFAPSAKRWNDGNTGIFREIERRSKNRK